MIYYDNSATPCELMNMSGEQQNYEYNFFEQHRISLGDTKYSSKYT